MTNKPTDDESTPGPFPTDWWNLPTTHNAVFCPECRETWIGPEMVCRDHPEEHKVEPVYVTKTPLGYTNDQEFWEFGRDEYEYPAQYPRDYPYRPGR